MDAIGPETLLQIAKLNVEAMAMNDAALADDLDEARFRAHLIRNLARERGLAAVLDAAEDVVVLSAVLVKHHCPDTWMPCCDWQRR